MHKKEREIQRQTYTYTKRQTEEVCMITKSNKLRKVEILMD